MILSSIIKLLNKKHPNRYWVKLVFLFYSTLISITISINFIADPYQVFSLSKSKNFLSDNQRYLNAGLAKNYSFETLFTGSSMSANFYLHDVLSETSFTKPLKLSFEGGSIFELNALINLAILKNKDLKNIILSLDYYAFNSDSRLNYPQQSFPLYLYDENSFNDLKYLLNFRLLTKSIKSIATYEENNNNFRKLDTLYSWYPKYKDAFNKKNILLSYQYHTDKFNTLKIKDKRLYIKDYSTQELTGNFTSQLLTLIKQNPNINFYLFYPPYSKYAYKMMKNNNIFNNYIQFKLFVYNSCRDLSNVKLYDFQYETNITTELSYYKDIFHYHPVINKWILSQFEKKRYLIKTDKLYKEKFY